MLTQLPRCFLGVMVTKVIIVKIIIRDKMVFAVEMEVMVEMYHGRGQTGQTEQTGQT